MEDSPFNPKLLRTPTAKTLLFLAKIEEEPSKFKNELGGVRQVSAEFVHENLMKWKSGKYWVFIWKEKIHDKKVRDDVTLYFNHYLYHFWLVPGGQKVIVAEAKHKHDYGISRVIDSLKTLNAFRLLTITDEDIDGYQFVIEESAN